MFAGQRNLPGKFDVNNKNFREQNTLLYCMLLLFLTHDYARIMSKERSEESCHL